MQPEQREPCFLGDEQLCLRLKHCKDLPSPPSIAAKILELSEDDSASFSDVADVISIDPALTAKILRIANSPIYAKQRKIDNLRQAIMVLGLNSTLMLALSFSMVSSIEEESLARLDHNLFWKRSLESACACRLIGQQLGFKNTEDFFLAGLLSDIGMLALDKIMPDFYSKIANTQENHRALKDAEQQMLGTDHARAGAWLLESWKLPQRWVMAVAGSHDPDAIDIDSEFLPLAQAAAIASDIADINRSGDTLQALLSHISQRADKWLKLDKTALNEIFLSLTDETSEFSSLFNIDLGDKVLMSALMEQAREQLMIHSLKQSHEADRLQKTAQALETRTRELEQQSRLDVLTGVYNRAHVDSILKNEFEAAKTHGWPLALMFIDLDHFKDINDNYGHQAGDKVLCNTAQLLSDVARDTDVVARYGGEEFLIVLPGTGTDGAIAASERLMNTFRNTRHKVNGDNGTIVTCSIGIAIQGEKHEFGSVPELIAAADRALYGAKFSGRNQAMVYNDTLRPLG